MSQVQILPIKLDQKRVIYAEVTALGGEEDVAAHVLSFDGAIEAIQGMAQRLTDVFETVKPEKATAEFNIQLSTASGGLTALLVNGEATASLKIALQWGKDK